MPRIILALNKCDVTKHSSSSHLPSASPAKAMWSQWLSVALHLASLHLVSLNSDIFTCSPAHAFHKGTLWDASPWQITNGTPLWHKLLVLANHTLAYIWFWSLKTGYFLVTLYAWMFLPSKVQDYCPTLVTDRWQVPETVSDTKSAQ